MIITGDHNIYTEHSIRTYSGKVFDIEILDPDSICIEDIAHGLSNTCRFGGQLENFYSVAQHSVYVAMEVPHGIKLAALLHDAAEAYIGDMPSPFKKLMPDYKKLETRIMQAIALKFGFAFPLSEVIKRADEKLLQEEWNAFVLKKNNMDAVSPEKAKRLFLSYFNAVVDL